MADPLNLGLCQEVRAEMREDGVDLRPLTGSSTYALEALIHLFKVWDKCGDPLHTASLTAMRALVGALHRQDGERLLKIVREMLRTQGGDFGLRKLWPLIAPGSGAEADRGR